jgi:La-related protein 7
VHAYALEKRPRNPQTNHSFLPHQPLYSSAGHDPSIPLVTTSQPAMAAQEGSDGDANAVPPTPMSAPASFKFNVHAPEFVPMSPTAATSPMSAPAGGYYSPFLQMQAAPDWSFLHDHEPVFFMPDFAHAKFAAAAAASNSAGAKGGAGGGTTDVAQKIVKQVEYQFSDINLVANEFLLKIMNKDSEGYGKRMPAQAKRFTFHFFR